jgi:hypothetical protein
LLQVRLLERAVVGLEQLRLLPPWIFNDARESIGGMSVSKDALRMLHTPVLYLLGGPTDIAYANGQDDVSRIDHVLVAWVNLPFGHGGTYARPMGGLPLALSSTGCSGRSATMPARRAASSAPTAACA